MLADMSPDKIDADDEHPGADHWPEMARQWAQIGPPLRPARQDLDFYMDAAREWSHLRGAPRILQLGVTPEIYRLPWPKGADFLAVDYVQGMIDHLWPGPKAAVQCRNWLDMKLPKASRDIVFCDGGLHLLAYPNEQGHLVRLLRDILSDEGICVFRLFVPPTRRETPAAVLKDLLAGRVPNLNILKLRLGMSLLRSAKEGVEVAAVWRTMNREAPNLEDLALRIGWPVPQMLAINAYRNSTARYCFVTTDEAIELFCVNPGGFEIHHRYVPSYELGGQCPTIVLRRCSTARPS